jgi:type I restriction enzyme S subunit
VKAGWRSVRLGDVAEIAAGNPAPQNPTHFSDSGAPFFRTSDAGKVRFGRITDSADKLSDIGRRGLRLFPVGTILFPKSGASTFLNHRVMLDVEGYVSSHLATILPKMGIIEPSYLHYYLNTVDAKSLMQDQSYPSLRLSDISEILIELPSLREQQHIVAILDESFAAIATAKANAERNIVNSSSILCNQVSYLLSDTDRNWKSYCLEDVISDSLIGLSRNSKEQGQDCSFPYVKMNNITRDNRFDFTDYVRINASVYDVERFRLQIGDFLFNTRNSRELVGKSCVFDGQEDNPVLFNNNIMRIRFKPEFYSRFVLMLFSTPDIFEELDGMKSGTTNVSAIYFKDLKRLKLRFPPFSEQMEIVEKLDKIATETQFLQDINRQKICKLNELRMVVLHQAFSGQLTTRTTDYILAEAAL